ncbi:MAG: glycyl radical protein [Firmicutes bacterium]|nr:glycyl radical protein [Bacillota bacterium]
MDSRANRSRVEQLRETMLCIPEICIERAYLMTESYRETEDEPPVLRRAKALRKILTEMTICIEQEELLVGRATGKRRAGTLTPEVNYEWYLKEMETLSTREWDRFQPLTEQEKNKMKEFLPYWKNNCLFDKYYAALPKNISSFEGKTHISSGPKTNMHLAHCAPGYQKVLTKGLNDIKKEIEHALASLDLTDYKSLKKYQFLEAATIAIDATISFAKRYAELAARQAEKETDSRRKKELERIAEICDWVPANPARNFYEALQSLWFAYLVVMIEGWGPGMSFGRPDQYLYPFYKKDIEQGIITREFARELIALFFIKLNGLTMPFSSEFVQSQPGYAMLSTITLGGIDSDGRDAVNELSYLFLEAEADVGLHSEDIVIRVHKNNPDLFLSKACQVAKKLRGKFKFVGDETAVQQLLVDGIPAQYARDYIVAGCFIPTVPARSHNMGGDFINGPLMLELALNNGVSRLTGQQMGVETGDPRNFSTYEEIWEAYKKQVEAQIKRMILPIILSRELYAEYLPTPFQSTLFEGCIEKGIDVTDGGVAPYMTQAIWFCGAVNVGDSLAAIKKLVFEEKRFTMARLIKALDSNFEGEGDAEILHLLKSAPKFGNNDDYVDNIVGDVLGHARTTVNQYKGFRGEKFILAASSVTANLPFGKSVGALPDGRRAGEPLSEGGISPHQGRNNSGPTATLSSVAKLDSTKISGGSVLNMRFHPDSLKDEIKMGKFVTLLRTFFESGGYLVQFNIVSGEILKAAQKYPEQYRDLLVRVATYSAYFVDLPKELQDDIIARTEFQDI